MDILLEIEPETELLALHKDIANQIQAPVELVRGDRHVAQVGREQTVVGVEADLTGGNILQQNGQIEILAVVDLRVVEIRFHAKRIAGVVFQVQAAQQRFRLVAIQKRNKLHGHVLVCREAARGHGLQRVGLVDHDLVGVENAVIQRRGKHRSYAVANGCVIVRRKDHIADDPHALGRRPLHRRRIRLAKARLAYGLEINGLNGQHIAHGLIGNAVAVVVQPDIPSYHAREQLIPARPGFAVQQGHVESERVAGIAGAENTAVAVPGLFTDRSLIALRRQRAKDVFAIAIQRGVQRFSGLQLHQAGETGLDIAGRRRLFNDNPRNHLRGHHLEVERAQVAQPFGA